MEEIIKRIFDDFIVGYFRRGKIESKIEEVIPVIESFGDSASDIIRKYEFDDARHMKVVVASENWRNGIIALSILVNEKNNNLRIFAYLSEGESYELMYSDLVALVGLPTETVMSLDNFGTIYSRLRQNYL